MSRAYPFVGEVEPAQVGVDDLVEHPLITSDDDELTCGAGGVLVLAALGIVVKHLSAVGVETS